MRLAESSLRLWEVLNMLADRARFFLALLFTLLLAACGGGGSGGPAGGREPPPATTGSLSVTIGLPSDVQGAVQVTGPDHVQHALLYTSTLTDLAPGNYVITADPIALGQATYVPSPSTQSVTVSPGATATASVDYAPRQVLLGLALVASGLDRPVFLGAPDDDARQFIVLRGGRILVLKDGKLLAQPFLDLQASVASNGDGGLLSVAFDPQFKANGYFFVVYTDLQQNIVVERYRAPAGAASADMASRLAILRIPHRDYTTHYGGQLDFGPDGYLYLSTGDGGGAYDPLGNGRNLASLLGKLLRIDVSHASASAPYAVPASNPYVGQAGKRPEIWASGLRNPWRFSFDGSRLYIADVGQDQREELDIADAGKGGLDYGWNTMEGTLCVKDGCDRTGLTPPALEYAHGALPEGPCAIVGGYVYRGAAMPELAGTYFYSDYCGGFLKSGQTGASIGGQRDWPVPPVGPVVSFGRDGQGELYLIAASGNVYKIGRTFPPKD
jgi:glucose/arabinose dehydrogenase